MAIGGPSSLPPCTALAFPRARDAKQLAVCALAPARSLRLAPMAVLDRKARVRNQGAKPTYAEPVLGLLGALPVPALGRPSGASQRLSPGFRPVCPRLERPVAGADCLRPIT